MWGNEKILLVDDDEGTRHVASLMLEAAGYKVFTAAGGEEALRLLSLEELQPAMLITDIDMPGMNGRELAHAASAQVSDMAVLYISGAISAIFGMPPEQAEFLQKPFSARELLRKVRELLDQPDVRKLR